MTTTDGPGFVHLHVHTSFSLREGALTIAKLTKLAAADAMPALAITDTNNLFGALEFSEKVAKAGLQPIIGIQLDIGFGDGSMLASRGGEDGAGRAPLVLLAKDEWTWRCTKPGAADAGVPPPRSAAIPAGRAASPARPRGTSTPCFMLMAAS